MLFPVLQCVPTDTVSSIGKCQRAGQVARLFQTKFLDQTEKVSLFEFGFKKSRQSVHKHPVPINQNLFTCEIFVFITTDALLSSF